MRYTQGKDIRGLLWETLGQHALDYSDVFIETTIRSLVKVNTCESLDDYFNKVNTDSKLMDQLKQAFNVHYSLFFREPLVFALLEKTLLPKLVNLAKGRRLRVWCAGCSSGEEPYSLAMTIDHFEKNCDQDFQWDVFASDIDQDILTCAENGIYHKTSLCQVPYGFIDDYFIKGPQGYQVSEFIKDKVQFSLFDLLDTEAVGPSNSIFSGYDLIICANVLYYYSRDRQDFIMNKLVNSTTDGGFIITDDIADGLNRVMEESERLISGLPIFRINNRSEM